MVKRLQAALRVAVKDDRPELVLNPLDREDRTKAKLALVVALLDEAKRLNGSDNRTALALGVARQNVSSWRKTAMIDADNLTALLRFVARRVSSSALQSCVLC
jgi:hypothetical protein